MWSGDDDDRIDLEEQLKEAEADIARAKNVMTLAADAVASACLRADTVRKRLAEEASSDKPRSKRHRTSGNARGRSHEELAVLLMEAALADPVRLPRKQVLDHKLQAWFRGLVLQRLAACPKLSPNDFIKSKNMGTGFKDPNFMIYHGSKYFKRRLPAGTFFATEKQAAERYCFKWLSDNTEAFVHRLPVSESDMVIDLGSQYEELKFFFDGSENAAGIVRGMISLGVLEELDKMGIAYLCICYQSMEEFVLVKSKDCVGASKYVKWTKGSTEVDLEAMAAQQALDAPVHRKNLREAKNAGIYF